jgi:hypothetical protein
MTPNPSLAVAGHPREAQRAAILAAVGAWTVVVPYLGKALGLVVDVPGRVEVADHVVPGTCIVAAALLLRGLARGRGLRGEARALLASGVCFLAGIWVLATHVPLLADAAGEAVPWDAAIWHSIAALPIVGLACWFVLRSIPDP